MFVILCLFFRKSDSKHYILTHVTNETEILQWSQSVEWKFSK